MNILIIDDQSDARGELVELLGSVSPDADRIRQATNGQGALEEIEKDPPEVIFLDMNMPGMDGVAFLQAYAKLRLNAVLIVVSAYDDFAYMQSAVRYKADHYLLKPIRTADLYDVLVIARARFMPDASAARPMESELQRYLSESLNRYLKTGDVFVDVERVFERSGTDFFPGDVFWVLLLSSPEVPAERVQSALEEALASERNHSYVYTRDERCVAICCDRSQMTEAGLQQTVAKLDLKLCGGISAASQGIRSLPQAYRQAEDAFWAGVHAGALISARDVHMEGDVKECGEYAARLVDSIVNGDRAAVNEVSAELFRSGLFAPTRPREDNFNILSRLVRALFQQMEASHGALLSTANLNSYHEQMRFFQALMDSEGMFDAKVLLVRFLEDILGALECIPPELKADHIIRNITSYIAKHLASPLSVTRIANEFSMNYSYISNLFSRKMGITMTAYINSIRLKKARDILENQCEKVSEVGRKVGFSDAKRFAKAFKKECGLTPTEYRRQCTLRTQKR